MNNDYKLLIDTMICDENGIVEQIEYRFFAEDDPEHQAAVSKTLELDPPESTEITEFENLSESQVSDWIHSRISEEELAEIYQKLDEQLEQQRKPPRNRKPPWSSKRSPKLRQPKGVRDKRDKKNTQTPKP